MNRPGRTAALLLLALWIWMISAPAVFGSPECICPDCTSTFCAMKKHAEAAPKTMAHLSCHETAPGRGQVFQKGACHHETGPVAFSYQAVLPDADRTAQPVAQFVLTGFIPQSSGGNDIPETPPPKRTVN